MCRHDFGALVGIVVILSAIAFAFYSVGYDNGQRDALNGKWHMVKLKDADGHEYVVEKH